MYPQVFYTGFLCLLGLCCLGFNDSLLPANALVRASQRWQAKSTPTIAPAENLNDAASYYIRGFARYNDGDLKGAIEDFSQASILDPGYVEAYLYRGFVRSQQGDRDGAIADYNLAIELDGDRASAYFYRGLAGNPNAIADFDRAIELDPDYTEAYRHRSIARRQQGDLSGLLPTAIELFPSTPTTLTLTTREATFASISKTTPGQLSISIRQFLSRDFIQKPTSV